MSWAALRWAETVDISSLPGDPSTNRLMLILLARRAGDCGHAYPNQAMLAATMGKSRRTIIGVVEDLLAAGLIAVYHRNRLGERHRSNIYRVQFPDPVAGDDCPGCDADRDTLPISAPNGNAPQVQPVAHVEVQPVAHVHTRTSDNPNPEVQPEEKNKTARDHSSDPQWLTELHEIAAWSCDRDAWIVEKIRLDGLDASVLLRTALALAAKWEGSGYKRPDLTFRNWAHNEQERTADRRTATAPARNGSDHLHVSDWKDCPCSTCVVDRDAEAKGLVYVSVMVGDQRVTLPDRHPKTEVGPDGLWHPLAPVRRASEGEPGVIGTDGVWRATPALEAGRGA